MGLKMSFAVLLTTEPGMAFTAESVHDSDEADRVARLLMPNIELAGTATLGEAMYSDRLMIGAYGTSMMIGDPRLFEAEPEDVGFVADQIADLKPNARCVVGVMQNVCDRVWLRAVEDGHLIREFGAVSDIGEVLVDRGERCEAELPFWSRDRCPELSDEEWDAVSVFPFSAESFGDVVIGDLAFGAPLTRLPQHMYKLPVTVFEPRDLGAPANLHGGTDHHRGNHE